MNDRFELKFDFEYFSMFALTHNGVKILFGK